MQSSLQHTQALALESLVRSLAREHILPYYLKATRTRKPDGSFITEADTLAQRLFEHNLPGVIKAPVLGEEMGAEQQADLWQHAPEGVWCIDPIDGTTNFSNGLPYFAVSIAYIENGQTQIGVVYNPVTDESFYAARGEGATLNGVPLPLKAVAHVLSDAVASVDLKRAPASLASEMVTHAPVYSLRNFGASALEWCFVAAGRIEVYLHGGQMLWDYAAGHLILEEAGGCFGTLDGAPLMMGPQHKRAVFAAASPALFAQWQAWIFAHQGASHVP